MPATHPTAAIHRFAALLVLAILFLISAGGLVKSLEAGLSVPDWPLSYGSLNPPRWWEIETVRAEHGHRLIAGTVALLTVGLAVWVGRRETRRWVRRLAYLAVAAVLAQALLGGITVLFFLPTAISVSHAALAQLFLCLVITLAMVTSGWWHQPPRPAAADRLAPVARLGTAVTGLVFVQILLGALVRHTGAGLAIPDFPLAFGRLVPPSFDLLIALHYAHRIGALVVLTGIVWLAVRAWRASAGAALPRVATLTMTGLALVQATLGAFIVLSGRAVTPNTLHVPVGAAVLASGVVASLSAWRLVHASAARSSRALPEVELSEVA